MEETHTEQLVVQQHSGGPDSEQTTPLSIHERHQLCADAVMTLMTKFADNEFALDRIQRICVEMLPHTIDSYVSQQNDRESRQIKLQERSDAFISSFLDSTPEYYYFQNNTFVSYDGEHYSLTNEDHIANRIVMSLSNDPELACRKHKLKTTIIKKIRERGTGNAVPSSHTIQSVLHPLYPSVFETRNETKYFLTILGDVLTKKHSDVAVTYFVHHRAKEFIDYIISGLVFLKASSATVLANMFKYRFQNHSYSTSRVIRIQGEGDSLYYPNLNILDLFFVSQYYSNRYDSADSLLQQPSFSNVARHALVLANLGTEKKVVEWFTGEAFEASATEDIDAKTVQYMWKRFCHKMKIPNVVQNASLIPVITSLEPFRSAYDADTKTFKGFTGNRQYNPSIGLFLEFWSDAITVVADVNTPSSTGQEQSIGDDEFSQLEIDEVATMFNSWVRKRGHPGARNGFALLDEDEILGCIKHFCPSVIIEDEKFINGITCSLWDKQKDVFTYIESQVQLAPDATPRTADSLYRSYCNRKLRTSLCVASKGYFERACNHLM